MLNVADRSNKVRSENWLFGSATWKPLGPSQKLFCLSVEAGSRENGGRKVGGGIDSLEKACPKGEKWAAGVRSGFLVWVSGRCPLYVAFVVVLLFIFQAVQGLWCCTQASCRGAWALEPTASVVAALRLSCLWDLGSPIRDPVYCFLMEMIP